MIKEKTLSDKKEIIIDQMLRLFSVDFDEPMHNVKQIHKESDLIDYIFRNIEKHEKKFIKLLKKLLLDGEYYGYISFTDLFKKIDELAGDNLI